ncbi:hypothetical protein L208DRAFT_1325446, partial [Tricholoma matsutake]
YKEFCYVECIWHHLATQRRSGQAHAIDTILTHWRPGSLMIRCPSCPEYTLFLSMDGNFRLQQKRKNGDPDNVALNQGNAYFVENAQYKKYLACVQPDCDKSTCSHLRAVRLQNLIKFKNADISGVVAVQCARHGFYMPQGLVDLMKGEVFANTDYALAFALAKCMNNHWIMLSYNIWCQFWINLLKRFFLWAFKYIKYSGETYGEMIETGWVEQNQTAGSTKEQNDGHHHDTLNDFFGYWNWTKYHQTSTSPYIYLTISKVNHVNSCYTYMAIQSCTIPD